MSAQDVQTPDKESLRTQLGALNERSRLYGRQLWQVPFAYAAVAGVSLNAPSERFPTGTILCVLGWIGVIVIAHMAFMMIGVYRAVLAIQAVEEQLYLPRTAKWACGVYMYPMVLLVVFVTVLAFMA